MKIQNHFILLIGLISKVSHAGGVTWEEQSERLQFVSSSLLDHLPMAEMVPGLSNLMIKSNVSKLPQTNSTIGAKREKVPSSPIHAIPTVQFDVCRDTPISVNGVRIWGGMLPSGSEKLVGLTAKLSEKSFGAGLLFRLKMPGAEPSFEIGAQRTIAKVEGGITALDANDKFHVDTLIGYGAAGVRFPTTKMWANLLTVARSSRSKFSIPSDGTEFSLNDNQAPVGFQLSAGVELLLGINIGVGQLYLPERLTMTRVLFGSKVAL